MSATLVVYKRASQLIAQPFVSSTFYQISPQTVWFTVPEYTQNSYVVKLILLVIRIMIVRIIVIFQIINNDDNNTDGTLLY